MEASKVCIKCHTSKLLSKFYNCKFTTDGKLGTCKKCSNAHSRNYQKTNRTRINAQRREWYATNPQYRQAHYGRCALNAIIRGTKKNYKFLVNSGAGNKCELITHLMSTIPAGYTLRDYGTHDYDGKLCVDHIIPCAFFDLTISSEFWKCFNYKNLRLVPKEINAKKGYSHACKS